MARAGEVLVSFPSLMNEHVLYYIYLFFERVRKLVQAFWGVRNSHSSLKMSTFVGDSQFYKNEICVEAFAKNLEPIICSDMVCLSIFRGVVMTYVHLVCLSISLNFVHFTFCLFSDW
jgi:hypothetical protein